MNERDRKMVIVSMTMVTISMLLVTIAMLLTMWNLVGN